MLCQSLDKACTFENITAGFTKTGISPLNSDIFTAADFLSSTVFMPKHSIAANPNHIESAVSSQAHKSSEPVAGPSSDPEQSLILFVQYETMSEEEEAPPLHDSSFKLLTDIRPLPNYDRDQVETTTTVQKRNCGYSKVLTSSPEKDKLLMIMNVKKRKMGDKPNRKIKHSKITKTNKSGKRQVRISTDDAENDNNSSDSSNSDDGTVPDRTDESEYSEPETKLHDDWKVELMILRLKILY